MSRFYVTTYLPNGLGKSPCVPHDPVAATSHRSALASVSKKRFTLSENGPLAATVTRPGEYPVPFYFEPRKSVPAKTPVAINFRRGRSSAFRARLREAV